MAEPVVESGPCALGLFPDPTGCPMTDPELSPSLAQITELITEMLEIRSHRGGFTDAERARYEVLCIAERALLDEP